MTIIHILNHQTGELIGHLDSESDKFFWDAKHVHGLDGEHSQQLTMPADLEEAALLEGRTRFLIPLEDGGFEEFIHFESDTQMEDEKTIYGTPYYKEMDKKYILPPGKYIGTAKELADLVLPFVKFEVGVVEDINKRTITIDRHVGAYSFLEKISSAFNLEMQFRLTTAGSRITGRFADFFKRIGADTRKEIELGKDLLAINKKEHATRIVTGLFCIGPEREDGTMLTTTIFDDDAFQRWNEDGEHIVDIYEPESTEQDMTLAQLQQYGRTELNKRIASVYEYTVTAASLEELFPHEKVRLGDGVRLKNPEFSPPLYADARVIRIERSLTDPDAKTYDIGEIVTYDEDEILQSFRRLQQQHNMRVIRSTEKPLGSSNKIWVQIAPAANGKPAMEVPHVWSTQLNDWVKVAPTTAAEIGAEPEIPTQPTPPDPAIHKKWVDNSSEIAELKMWNATTSTWDAVQGPPGPPGAPGYTPVKGTDYFDGAPGQDGTDGTSSYLWIRYSQNADGSGMVDYPIDAKYIGVATTQIGVAPTAPSAYRWTLIKGTDGLPGEPGSDGKTSYLHIKYSNDGGVTFTASTGEDAGSWIGTYVDFTVADSTNVAAYTWNKVKGDKGETGDPGKGIVSAVVTYQLDTDGTSAPSGTWSSTIPAPIKGQYLWTRTISTYTDNSTVTTYSVSYLATDGQTGKGISSTAVAYQIGSSGTTAPTGPWSATVPAPVPGSYLWTRTIITYSDNTTSLSYSTAYYALDGQKGDPGAKGDPGQPTYTWVKYADDISGGGMSDSPTGKKYIGMAFNKLSATESLTSADYTWSPLFESIVPIANGKVFHNPNGASYYAGGTVTGALIVETPIMPSKMITMRITGYNYLRDKASIDIAISFYAYTNGALNYSYINKGDFPINRVRIGIDSTGKFVLILGETNTSWSYPSIKVESMQASYQVPPDDWIGGWKMSTNSVLPTLTNQIEISGKDILKSVEVSQATADGKNTIFYQSTAPSAVGRKENDVWFNTGDGNRMNRFVSGAWTLERFGENAISDLSITNAKIKDGTIDSAKIANLDAAKITSGIIDSVTYRSGYGTMQRFELSGGTATFIEDTALGTQTITKINDDGVSIQAKDGATVDYSARLTAGGVFLGYESIGYKGKYSVNHLILDDTGLGETLLSVESAFAQLVSKKGLRIQGESEYNFLSNGGYSILGGQLVFHKNSDPTTNIKETGFMAIGSMGGGTTGFTTFGATNFRTRKTYTPASISYTTISSNRDPSFYDINPDGFMFALNGSGTTNALVFFRGKYTA
ncbi:phage tail spike protein [Planococcus halotolerans]|uniref:Tail spike domain-containing protein n=1 Tax=Planococcus halotolerans TaxID=2233542 RepID=A0A365KKG6_9BACL|nr:phage tail spike protein [Planococcus halotolerans]RAZ73635.1 hypothetical protein DP120_17010 [Planococcus halotolerans]